MPSAAKTLMTVQIIWCFLLLLNLTYELYYTVIMREFQEKENLKNNLFRMATNLSWGCFIGPCFFHCESVQKKPDKRQKIRRNKKEEMAKLEKRNAELAAEAARLESESGKEGEIRKRFDVAKPGEKSWSL